MIMAHNMLQLRLVTIGKTGVGKSETCNAILKRSLFRSTSQGSSVTESCQLGVSTVFERNILVVDTPGIWDTRKNGTDVKNEIMRCVAISSPGPHAILFVASTNRFTDEDTATVDTFIKHFGEALQRFIIVVFTRFDDYKHCWKKSGNTSLDGLPNEEKNEKMIKTYIASLPEKARDFVRYKCGGRAIGFDNRLEGDEADEQLRHLFKLIDKMVEQNEWNHYTNEDYNNAEIAIQRQIQEEKEKMRKEIQAAEETNKREMKYAANEIEKQKLHLEFQEFKNKMETKMEDSSIRNFIINAAGPVCRVAEIIMQIVTLSTKAQ